MTDSNEGLAQVTQADRELFKRYFGFDGPVTSRYVDDGQYDNDERMQTLARHRSDNTDELVEALEHLLKVRTKEGVKPQSRDAAEAKARAVLAKHKERQP